MESVLQTLTNNPSENDQDSASAPKRKRSSKKNPNLGTIEETPSGGSSLLKNPFRTRSEEVGEKRRSVLSLPFRRDSEGQNGDHKHPPMTWRRFMAIFSLGCLLAAAQIPLYLLGGSLCISIF